MTSKCPRGSERGTCLSQTCLTSYLITKANILINRDKQACIADFGLVTVTGVATRAAARSSRISIGSFMPFTPGGTYRWMSPELLDPERFGGPQSEESARPTTQSDCYAFGMVIYEVSVRVNKFIVTIGQFGYPRSYAGTTLTLKPSRTLPSWMRSRMVFGRRNLRGKNASDLPKIYGE